MIDLSETGLQRKKPAAHGIIIVFRDGGFPLDTSNLAQLGRPTQAHRQKAVEKGPLGTHEEPETEGPVIGAHAAETGIGHLCDGAAVP